MLFLPLLPFTAKVSCSHNFYYYCIIIQKVNPIYMEQAYRDHWLEIQTSEECGVHLEEAQEQEISYQKNR